MIRRGTWLYPELFGPENDKQDFRVFDFFRENQQGIESGSEIPLSTRLFRYRVQLLSHVQAVPELGHDNVLTGSLTEELHGELTAMNQDNFIVRMHQWAVSYFQNREV